MKKRNLNNFVYSEKIKFVFKFAKILTFVLSSEAVSVSPIFLSDNQILTIEQKVGYQFREKNHLKNVFYTDHQSLLEPTEFKKYEILGSHLVDGFVGFSVFSLDPLKTLQDKFLAKTNPRFLREKLEKLGLLEFVKGEKKVGENDYFSGVFKALIAAIYIDAKTADRCTEFEKLVVKLLEITPNSQRVSLSSPDYSKKEDFQRKLVYQFREQNLLSLLIPQNYYFGRDESKADQLSFLGEKIMAIILSDILFKNDKSGSTFKNELDSMTLAARLGDIFKQFSIDTCLKDELKTKPDVAFKNLVAIMYLDSVDSNSQGTFFKNPKKLTEFLMDKVVKTFSISQPTQVSLVQKDLSNTSLSEEYFKEIETKIGYTFKDKKYLKGAFFHSSLPTGTMFEKLEHLGDRIIGFVVESSIISLNQDTKTLQEQFEEKTNNAYFAEIFKKMGIIEYVQCNRSSLSNKVFGDTFEALVGAVRFDSKEEGVCPQSVVKFVAKHLDLDKKSLKMEEPLVVPAVPLPAPVVQRTSIVSNPFLVLQPTVVQPRPQTTSSIQTVTDRTHPVKIAINILDKGRSIHSVTGKAKNNKGATNHAINELCHKLKFPTSIKTLDAFRTECSKKGYEVQIG